MFQSKHKYITDGGGGVRHTGGDVGMGEDGTDETGELGMDETETDAPRKAATEIDGTGVAETVTDETGNARDEIDETEEDRWAQQGEAYGGEHHVIKAFFISMHRRQMFTYSYMCIHTYMCVRV